jgi:threonine dehydratase
MRLSLTNIEEAASIVDPVFLRSPVMHWQDFAPGLGLYLKIETLNPIRSFKGRGADYFVAKLPASTKRLVAASAGNFGQGLAYAARDHGIEVDVFAAESANPRKVAAMRRFGARVHLTGRDFDAAKAAGKKYAAANGLFFAEDGREPEFSEGAGTIGVELAPLDLDALLIPLGNGALLGGVARWMKAHSPRTRIVGLCAATAPSMEQSWRRGKVVETITANTVADGIGVRVPIPEAVGDIRELMDECLLIGEARIRRAMRRLIDDVGIVGEGSGAIGVAAAQLFAQRFRGQRVAALVCGGNM